jgi:acetyl esterase
MLWPEEYEDFRAEARAVSAALSAGMSAQAAGFPDPADRTAFIAATRAMVSAMYVTSPAGSAEVLAGVPCRVFRPPAGWRGTYLHFHGGAMTVGSPLMNDVANAELAQALGVRVVSVDYRLAPEHPYPAGLDDCLAVAGWLVADESGPIAVGGESAGAYFAAGTLLRARDELGAAARFTGANLVYGVYDLTGTPSNRGARPSDAPDMLTPDIIDSVLGDYLPGRSREDSRDPLVSPLFADLRAMPPALFTVGFADHLLDDSLFMAARWGAFGAGSELAVYPDCGHGFLNQPMELTNRATQTIYAFLSRCLAG